MLLDLHLLIIKGVAMKLNSNLKQKFMRAVIGGVLIAGLLPATNAFALSTFPTSGSCAMLVTQPVPYGVPIVNGTPVTSGYNILAVITFTSATAATITFRITQLDYKTTGYTTNATHPSDTNLAVTLTAMTAPSEGRTLSFTTTGTYASTITANAVAVNGGNTVLIQGENTPFSGVCQF
jgi:hypothetical protein